MDLEKTPLMQLCSSKTRPVAKLVYTKDFSSLEILSHLEHHPTLIVGADGNAKAQVPQADGSTKLFTMSTIKMLFDRIRELRAFILQTRFNAIATKWFESRVTAVPIGQMSKFVPATAGMSVTFSTPEKVDFGLNFSVNPTFANTKVELPFDTQGLVAMPFPFVFEFFEIKDGKPASLNVEREWWATDVFPKQALYTFAGEDLGFRCTKPTPAAATDYPKLVANESVKGEQDAELKANYGIDAVTANWILQTSDAGLGDEEQIEASASVLCYPFIKVTAKTEASETDVTTALSRFLGQHPSFGDWRHAAEVVAKKKYGDGGGKVYERALWNGCVAGQFPRYRR